MLRGVRAKAVRFSLVDLTPLVAKAELIGSYLGDGAMDICRNIEHWNDQAIQSQVQQIGKVPNYSDLAVNQRSIRHELFLSAFLY
jgi:hypothetical protein